VRAAIDLKPGVEHPQYFLWQLTPSGACGTLRTSHSCQPAFQTPNDAAFAE